MTEFKIGDIVRMTKGEPDKPGHGVWVLEVASGDLSAEKISQSALRAFEDVGGKIELIERPAEPLPTAPNSLGWVTVDGIRHLARLGAGGVIWELYEKNGGLGATPPSSAISDFEEAVLIPKDLADEVVSWSNDARRRAWLAGSILQQAADFLKGQDDE